MCLLHLNFILAQLIFLFPCTHTSQRSIRLLDSNLVLLARRSFVCSSGWCFWIKIRLLNTVCRVCVGNWVAERLSVSCVACVYYRRTRCFVSSPRPPRFHMNACFVCFAVKMLISSLKTCFRLFIFAFRRVVFDLGSPIRLISRLRPRVYSIS